MRKQRKPESVIRKGSREVLEIVKSHWPVTPAEIIKLKHYRGNTTTGHGRFLHNLRTLQKAGLIELKRSGRVYIAWPKDVEKLRNDDLRNGLLGLREAMIRVVDTTMKERTRGRARQ
jgi:DNA-binding PadR family transcriptional regulator